MGLYVMVCYDQRGVVRHACAIDASNEDAAGEQAHRIFLNVGLSGYELWMGRQKVSEHFFGKRPAVPFASPDDQQGSTRLSYTGIQFS